MLRQIRLDKYPKKSSSFRAQLLSSLTLLQKKSYNSRTYLFNVYETQYQTGYQLYINNKLVPNLVQNIQFIQKSPNIILLQDHAYNLIIEEKYQKTLEQYIRNRQSQNTFPYLSQDQAKKIIIDVVTSLQSYSKNNLTYDYISQANIVYLRGKWVVGLAAALVANQTNNSNYYSTKNKSNTLIYAIGTLLFRLIFGYVPYQNISIKPLQFKFSSYINHLQHQSINKMLKIYYFADRIQTISKSCQQLIQDCLSGKLLSMQDFKQHAYFNSNQQSGLIQKFLQLNRQIKMINFFDKQYNSLVMASIQYRKKNSYQKLNHKVQSQNANFLQAKQTFAKDPLLLYLKFANLPVQSVLKRSEDQYQHWKIDFQYFGREFQVADGQRPTLQLIKLIKTDYQHYPDAHRIDNRQSKIKLYAYPYIMVFQLYNVYQQQPIQIKRKIQQLVPLLLQVSSLNWPVTHLQPLYNGIKSSITFQSIKLKYRESINQIYKHFMLEAMKRYNAKKQNLTNQEKIKLKEEGLEYYRLCLKLMELSLLVRKQGNHLDLQRIQTSQRKEIQQDLELLLKTYFPNRVEIN